MKYCRVGIFASVMLCFGIQLAGNCQNTTTTAKVSVPTLYAIGYTHLDTEWCWSYPQVIDEFLPNTLHQNFDLFKKYPDYTFNWTGANRYKLMKEYYPADYAELKKYVAAGRWYPNGSSLEEGDVDLPSEESVIRQILYGNEYFKHEFGVTASDFMLPDCFGFPASLPSILAHCGVKGFSTQKLTWGSAVGIPFNVGVWDGPDGQSVFAVLNAGDYNQQMSRDFSVDKDWEKRLADDAAKSGLAIDCRYYGLGDRGGSVRDSDVAGLEKSLAGTGPVHVISARADQIFDDLQSENTSQLPHYKGDLLLTHHTSGTTTSAAEMKRWNHENEKLADATERASIAADWLGAAPYDKERITDAWWKFLPGQFHDLMAGTALPKSYQFAWNDQILAMNEFAGVLQNAVGGTVRGLDTEGPGVPLVVYNPLSHDRQDVVEATVNFGGPAPALVHVVGADGRIVPSQIENRNVRSLKILYLATAPSVGYATYHVCSGAGSKASGEVSVSARRLENAQYRVELNDAGDVASIFDKKTGKELLSSPARLAFQFENPAEYPAWNMDWEDQSKPAEGYVDGPVKISISEQGPVRASLQVDRWARGSHIIQTIRLSSGAAGNHVEFYDNIDWMSKECALMEVLPLTVSNPLATYNWELGTIARATDDSTRYEVPAHQWLDLTDSSNKYGVAVLSGDRYGSDKPDDHTLRLTLLYTPGTRAGYQHQGTQDWGHHELTYGLAGHQGDWRRGQTQWAAMRLDRPMLVFQATPHPGSLGKSFSFVHVDNADVSIEAMKQAEGSREIVVRFNELAGRPQEDVHCHFAGDVLSVREINGQEQLIGPGAVHNGDLVFSTTPYRPRAFAVTLAAPPAQLGAPQSRTVKLPFNTDVEKPFGSTTGGKFSADGSAIPADMLPAVINSNGVEFDLAPTESAVNAVVCKGQRIALPSDAGGQLNILAASNKGDVDVTFRVGDQAVKRTIQAWNGMLGQWDDRIWGGVVPELTYNVANPMIGLNRGYIKRDPVAWYSDHIRSDNGSNLAYAYCYLFRYTISIPKGCGSVTMPNNPAVTILAATVETRSYPAIVAAEPLYDTLAHTWTTIPHIESSGSNSNAEGQITAWIDPPLYFQPTHSLHYTLDGSAPTLNSAVYSDPIRIRQTSLVTAAYIKRDGGIDGVAKSRVSVGHPVAPKVVNVLSESPTDVTVYFTQPISRSSAESTANYTITPAGKVVSASLADGSCAVKLRTEAPVQDGAMIGLHGIASAVANVPPLADTTSIVIPPPNVVFQMDKEADFDAKSQVSILNTPMLPVKARDSWTINLFAYFDKEPEELTALGGFGDESDNPGTQRYFVKYQGDIHFWGSNVDVSTGVPYDLGKWQMVTATYDGAILRLYKNGVLLKTSTVSLNDAVSQIKIGVLGPWSKAHKLNGKIAGFRIWNTDLAGESISNLIKGMPEAPSSVVN